MPSYWTVVARGRQSGDLKEMATEWGRKDGTPCIKEEPTHELMGLADGGAEGGLRTTAPRWDTQRWDHGRGAWDIWRKVMNSGCILKWL